MMYVDRSLFFVFMLAVAFLLLIVAVIRRNFYITEIPEIKSPESSESDDHVNYSFDMRINKVYELKLEIS